MWVDNKKGNDVESVVIDYTYATTPWLDIFRGQHVARIVVLLHLVKIGTSLKSGDPIYLVRRQEDLIQFETILAAFFPNAVGQFVVLGVRILTRIVALVTVYVMEPLTTLMRMVFG